MGKVKWWWLIVAVVVSFVGGVIVHETTGLFAIFGMSDLGELRRIGAEMDRATEDLADAHSQIAEYNRRDEDRLEERAELLRRIGELEEEREGITRRASERLDRTDQTFTSIGSVVDAIEAEFQRLSEDSGRDD